MKTKLIVGLGNLEVEHRYNRHNTGYMLVKAYADYYKAVSGVVKCGRLVSINYLSGPNTTLLLRPHDGMNVSGQSIGAVVKALDIQPEDILLIHDDLDLDFGTIRIKPGGGSGGHRGVQSTINAIGPSFNRFKVGIGRLEEGTILDYVLSDFTLKERTNFCELCAVGIKVIDSFVGQGIQRTMSQYNR